MGPVRYDLLQPIKVKPVRNFAQLTLERGVRGELLRRVVYCQGPRITLILLDRVMKSNIVQTTLKREVGGGDFFRSVDSIAPEV